MKSIFTLTAVLLIGFTTTYAQNAVGSTEKIKTLLQQDKHIIQFDINEQRGTPAAIRFDSRNAYPKSETGGLLQTWLTARSGVDAFAIKNETEVYGGISVVRYQQLFKGIKVEFGDIVAVSKNETLSYIMAENYVPDASKTVIPALHESAALSKAISITGAERYAWQDKSVTAEDGGAYPKGELVLMPDMRREKTGMVLAWKFDIYATEPLSRDYVYISAEDGSLIFKNAIIKHSNASGTAATRYSGTKTITTDFTGVNFRLRETSTFMNGIETYRKGGADLVDNDNNWTAAEWNTAAKEDAALDAHWGAEQVVAYWKTIHNRNSYNNQGAKVKSYIHNNDAGADNAFWDGSSMNYGDGTGGTAGYPPLTSLDVCAHEIGHAVCESTSNLVYQGEPGALNEGFSDIWAACLENFADPNNTVYEPFLIGEQLSYGWVKGVNRNALRDMANPPAKGSPDTYNGTNWLNTSDVVDHGGVHFNSGVLNKWFYLLTNGESGTNDLGDSYVVTGIGFTKSQKIAFLTELSLTANSGYNEARVAGINAGYALYETNSTEITAITNAWYAVGIGPAVNNGGVTDIKISFLSAGSTVSEANTDTTSCHPGKNITVTMILNASAPQNVNVSINNFGTAKYGRDYTISPANFSFIAGGSRRADFTVTVYDNNIVEGDRTLILNYTVTGGATPGSTNQSYALRITDDDAQPTISAQLAGLPVTLLNEGFNGTAIPSGWSTGSSRSPAGANTFTFGSAANLGSSNSAYITNNTTSKPWDYTKNSTSNVYLLSPAISAENIGDLQLSFKYACKGEKLGSRVYDYGSIVYSFDNGATLIDYPNIQLFDNATTVSFTLPLQDNIFKNKTFRIGFRWVNDYTGGTNPPLAVDDVLLTGFNTLTNIETTAGHSRTDYVPINDPMFFYSQQDRQLIARIFNSTEQVGCVNAAVTQSGSGQQNLNVGFKQYKRTQKVFNLVPDAANTTSTYRLSIYFTPAELAIWGNKKLDLSFAAVRSGADLNGNISSDDIKIITPLTSNQGDGHIYYTGQFTGFSQVMLIDPAYSVNCITSSNTLYVDSSMAATGDGRTWENPLKTVAEAFRIANQCSSIQEIRVAKGTYFPTTNTSRDSSFRMLRNGIKLYGGYPAGGGTRNIAANPTILSGNIGNAASAADNSYHVMMIIATPSAIVDTSVRVDGFTITGGNANSFTGFTVAGQGLYHDNAGGIYCFGQDAGNSCKPLIANCTFYANRADNRGGAIFNEGYNGGNSSPAIINCSFYNNTAGYANGSGGDNGGGGAVFNNGPSGTSSPSVINCSFYGNNANTSVGGAIANYGNSVAAITNCIIYQNMNNSGNSNVANINGAAFTISNSIVQGGPAGNGNINADPLFVNAAAGNLQLQQCSPAINTGNAAALPENITTDITGGVRIFNATVDMGAYECRLLPTVFTFKGSGTWNTVLNWQCNWIPPSPLPTSSEIIVDPAGGDCLLNVPFTVGSGGKLTVKTGKKLIVQGELQLQ